MEVVKRLLNDVLLIQPNIKGDVAEGVFSYSSADLNALGINYKFVQVNHTRSAPNVLRGLHYQIEHPQGKLVHVLVGHIFDVAVDMRRSSPTYGQHIALQLKATDNVLLWIPPGYAHGFLTMGGASEVVYSVTDYRYAEFERTLLWSDAALGVNWPLGDLQPILSEKDRFGSYFSKCEYFN